MSLEIKITHYGTQRADQFNANPLNPRIHPQHQRDVIRASLQRFGIISPVVVSKRSGYLIDGHERVWQALAEGDDTLVPYVEADVEEDHEAELILTYDKSTMLAEYDPVNLQALMEQVNTDDEVLAKLFAEMKEEYIPIADEPLPDNPPSIDKAGELQVKWNTERGQLWLIPSKHGGEHRLLCGDSTAREDLSKILHDIMLVVTSPPYNQDLQTFSPSGMQKQNPSFVNRMASAYYDSLPEDQYQEMQIAMLNGLIPYLKPNASIYYNHKIRYRDKSVIHPMTWLLKTQYKVRQEIIWDRGSSITMNAKMFIPCDERIYWLRVGENVVFNDTTEIKSFSSVWSFGAVNDVSVSAPFAIELPKRCILASSNLHDIVADPYGGSGTTMVACEQTGRLCRMIEIEPKYVAVILERMATLGLEPRLA